MKFSKGKVRSLPFLLVVITLFFLSSYLLSDEIFKIAHRFLIVSDPIEKGDVIVVLGGGFGGERLEEGIRLFRKGYASKIILTGSLISRDISTADLELRRLLDIGISKELVYLNRDATSTYDNAVNAANIMKENGLKQAIVVTSLYHTRRARWIFRKIFNRDGLKVIVVPATPKEDLKTSFKTDSISEEIVFEYQKLIMYWLRY